MTDSFRTERDTMGDMQVAISALYGPQTARSVHNFPISGTRFPRSFIRALGMIKRAAAIVNGRMGRLTVPTEGEYPAEKLGGIHWIALRSVGERRTPEMADRFGLLACESGFHH